MDSVNKCLKIPMEEVRKDPALSVGNRGARKQIVTTLYTDKEKESNSDIWYAPADTEKCQVLRLSGVEMGVFNQEARQDRHYHKEGTEIYFLIEGDFFIGVEGKEYHLTEGGDAIVVNPFSVHEVKNKGNQYFCRVVILNCGGEQDKYLP